MKITIKSRSDKNYEECDYRNAIEISIDGKRVFEVADGEPEDSNLSRDFNDCWKIPELLESAY